MSREVRERGGDQVTSRILLKRIGKPEDIAHGVLCFASEEASWVTGQVLSIDGGHSIF